MAHFLGLHAAQLVPLAALSGDRRVVWGVAVIISALTIGLFSIGMAGMPVLRG